MAQSIPGHAFGPEVRGFQRMGTTVYTCELVSATPLTLQDDHLYLSYFPHRSGWDGREAGQIKRGGLTSSHELQQGCSLLSAPWQLPHSWLVLLDQRNGGGAEIEHG